MFANQILFAAGAAFVLVSSSPVPSLCLVGDDQIGQCGPIEFPDNTIGYTCNPPIVDAANAKLPYTYKNPTPDQKAVNRRIEKAMGRGECSYTDSGLQTIFDIFGPYLASVYPAPDYVNDEKIELQGKKACFVNCIDARDQPSIDWCNANGCPMAGIDKSGVYMSPDGLIRYKGVDIVYNTSPCNNQYLAAISADLCPILEGQDLGSTRNCVETCFSSGG